MEELGGSQLEQVSFRTITTLKKTTMKYSNKKVKIRNLLTNVSYRRYKPEDVGKTNFVLDVFSFLTQNLNPSGLDRKLERDFIKMIWNSCVTHKFTKFIYQKENFIELSQPHITYQKANNIVLKFVEEDAQNIDSLKFVLRDHQQTIQYVYFLFFPKSTIGPIGLEQTTNRILILSSPIGDITKPTKIKVVEQSIKKNNSRKKYNTIKTITTTTTK